MSTKLIVLLLGLLAAGVAGITGYYYGEDLFVREQEDIAAVEEPEASDREPEASAVPPAEEDEETAEPELVRPTFDIVRVEPSGEIVAAGRAAPGAEVDMLLDADPYASETATIDGEWSIVPASPLPVGEHELVLRATGADGLGGPIEGDRVAVVIEGEGRTPLVALSRPGEPSEIVQRPGEETVIAAAPASERRSDARPTSDEAEAEASPDADAGAARTDEPASRDAAAGDDGEDRPEGEPGAGQATSAGATAEAAGADDEAAGAEASGPDTRIAAIDPDPVASDRTDTPAEPPAESAPSDAPVADEVDGRDEDTDGDDSSGDALVAIDLVEVEAPDSIHITGRSDPESAIRLYVNNEHLGDAEAAGDGDWTATLNRDTPPGRYTVRADLVDGEGQVQARSEVRFDRVRVAMADSDDAPEEETETAEPEAAPEDGTETEVADAAPSTPAPDTLTDDGASEDADEGAAGQGERETVVAAAPSSDAEPADEPDEEPIVEIARGDNLWTIARSLYGQGVRYTVIYDANRGQIGDPDLIYPGQVFTIPVLEDADG